jgi:uncharacterized protein involved in exopolysaccharide biosynthesis
MPVDIARVLRALFRGKWWILGAALAGAILGFAVGKFFIPSTWVSDGVLELERPEGANPADLADVGSLAESIHSRPVLERVRDRLQIEGDIAGLRARIVVTSDANHQTIKVTAGDKSADSAATLVNTVMEVFMEYQAEREKERVEAKLVDIEGRVSAANTNLAAAREAYDEFRRSNGISDLTTDQEAQIEAATQARTDADVAQAEIGALEARIAQLERGLNSTPRTQVVNSTSPEAQELRRLQGELASLRSRLSEDHPRVMALEQQIATLRLRINSGQATQIAQSTGSARYANQEEALQAARADLAALRERHASLEQRATREAERVAAFSASEGQASALLARVRVNEALVTELTTEKARLEDSVRAPQSGFHVLTPAIVPDYPERNRTKYIAAGGIFGGFLLVALVFSLFGELKGLRVRTARELGYWGKGPVLGTTTWPRDHDGPQDLIASLDDYIPDAKGKMLVVGATEAEAELAHQIVDQLNHDWFPSSLIDLEAYAAGPAPGGQESAGSQYPLAKIGSSALSTMDQPGPTLLDARAWDGPAEGQQLRRAARLADRVMVVVTSGAMTVFDLAKIPTRLGRRVGVGYVLVGVDDELAKLPDRAGPVAEFWAADREE